MADNKKVLIIGASRGLGNALAKDYAEQRWSVTGTLRSSDPPSIKGVDWVSNVDVADKDVGKALTDGIKGHFDVVIISAGVFIKESFDEPDHDAQVQMYKTSAIGPIFITQALQKAGYINKGSKIILVSSEAGSITLRHESEGGGMYGHHASKAALNMVGKLLSLDLKEHGIAVALVHPAFMRTEMTKNVGFDKFWDDGGAVVPEEAAKSLREWVDTFDISKTGEYWAPRGPGDIGTAEPVFGKNSEVLQTPMHLPW
ncbi:Putative short-chain dehydrogenase/reductase SDR, NAD(P)-binding domain superfamily [Septoria linicola]|uniref:Short-chain dehydrogenase/reductase SDR, NAD(P)-binding domain superfamily n=1 Tax=Septoria linicola TaxID=215465 RepID=A0A9Q9BA86_9PEZI|nr:putative short-chain dehydrogenase/reductase SDR, NAD(P)-binding domain superfamily [Septoria linicola]USW59231.1 Putative short-chain dehydrogenase/reductase SDR, NAD(P)-binding domain superfamily [Septoria linicola]